MTTTVIVLRFERCPLQLQWFEKLSHIIVLCYPFFENLQLIFTVSNARRKREKAIIQLNAILLPRILFMLIKH